MIDEHLDLKEMVQDKVVAGMKALGAWFQRYRVEVGDIGIGTFKKLMSSLVESSMLYGAEIWGCSQNLEAVNHIQLRACRMFFGVGTLHPRVSLLLEMGDLPIVWLARMRCTLFWFKVLASKVYEGRILRRVAMEAVKYGKGSWMQKMLSCCREFGWQVVGAEQVQNMSEAELKGMLESVAWQRVRAE